MNSLLVQGWLVLIWWTIGQTVVGQGNKSDFKKVNWELMLEPYSLELSNLILKTVTSVLHAGTSRRSRRKAGWTSFAWKQN